MTIYIFVWHRSAAASAIAIDTQQHRMRALRFMMRLYLHVSPTQSPFNRSILGSLVCQIS